MYILAIFDVVFVIKTFISKCFFTDPCDRRGDRVWKDHANSSISS